MAWRAAFPATVLSLLAFVACRGATGDALPVAPAPRPSALAVAPSVVICPTAAPVPAPTAEAPLSADATPTVDPVPSVDPGPWISTLPRGAKRPRSQVRCGATHCKGDTPWCCPEATGPRCVSTSKDCEAGMLLECLSASDCGAGRICCTGGEGTECRSGCASGDTPLCQTDADCRGVVIIGPHRLALPQKHCLPWPEYGVKYCGVERE